MPKYIRYILVVGIFLFLASPVFAISIYNAETLAIGPTDMKATVENIITFSLGLLGILCFVGIVVSLPMYIRYNILLSRHKIVASSPSELVGARVQLLMQHHHWKVLVSILCIFLFLLLFSSNLALIVIILLCIVATALYAHSIKKKIVVFDNANPEVQEIEHQWRKQHTEVQPQIPDQHQEIFKKLRVWKLVLVNSTLILIITLVAWAITNFKVCCGATVTS